MHFRDLNMNNRAVNRYEYFRDSNVSTPTRSSHADLFIEAIHTRLQKFAGPCGNTITMGYRWLDKMAFCVLVV